MSGAEQPPDSRRCYDAYVWRRFNRLQQLLEHPDDVLADHRVGARVRAVQAAGPAGPASTDRPATSWSSSPAAGAAVA